MTLGFIGTGVVAEAIITGLMKSDAAITEILVSCRGEETSTRLAKTHPIVMVCDEN